MRILIFIIGSFIAGSSFGQIAFFNLYSGGGDDAAEGVVQLEDSSYIITGSSDSYPNAAGGSQAFLLKIDSTGVPLWSKSYGGPEMDRGRYVGYQPGFGLLVAGTTNSIGSGGYDFYLFKTDVNGVQEWERAYGKSGWERLYGAALTRDSGMFMVGETQSNPTDNQDMYIVRTDKNGDTLWTKTLGGLGPDGLRSVVRYSDSTFYVGGQTYIDDSLYVKAYIAKYHEDGTLLWSDTLGEDGNYFINDLNVSPTEVYGGGYRNGPSVGINDVYYIRYMHNGTPIGAFSQAIPDQDTKIVQLAGYGDQDKRFVGYTTFSQFTQPDGDDAIVSRTNANFSWEATACHLYYLDPDFINEIIPTSDGGAVIVGQTSSEAVGVHHAYVVKTGPNDLYVDYTPPQPMYGLIVSVDEHDVTDNLTIFPNPTDGWITIESPTNDAIELEFLNAIGQSLRMETIYGTSTLDLREFGNGLVFLKTTISGRSTVRKIIVK